MAHEKKKQVHSCTVHRFVYKLYRCAFVTAVSRDNLIQVLQNDEQLTDACQRAANSLKNSVGAEDLRVLRRTTLQSSRLVEEY